MIHPTAIVHPQARVASDVEIGPYTIIGEHVEIGPGTIIGSHAVITGHTRIGSANRIFQFVSLGAEPQDKKYGGEPTRLEIGDHNTIREFCTFNTGTVQDVGVTRVGDYNWIIDPKLPFKIKCPVDGTVFPTNDYAAYDKSGFKDKKGWDTQYVDDGWGWADPKTGEKYWFVAYYNHWMWHKHVVPAIEDLSQAYLLTGDEKYAHKAAVMLYRVAQVYPGMDHAKQSRYGTMMAARGIVYPGKIIALGAFMHHRHEVYICHLFRSVNGRKVARRAGLTSVVGQAFSIDEKSRRALSSWTAFLCASSKSASANLRRNASFGKKSLSMMQHHLIWNTGSSNHARARKASPLAQKVIAWSITCARNRS